MTTYIGLIPAIPLLSFLILGLFGSKMRGKTAGYIGTGAVGISAILTFIVAANYLGGLPEIKSYSVNFWQWISAGNLSVNISFKLDALSLVFAFVITFVGFLIHMYSIEFMANDESFSKFFAYMNLFVGSMLILVLASNMLVLYMGWEGVGLCSYLLIGFWYKKPENGYAARKAFIFTRIGDTAMILGIFLLFLNFGTLNIHQIMQMAPGKWSPGSTIATVTAALLLGGALGKSAQLPLQSWLPDAMAGPSPVSALIHAATMVTAGVYLIARTHVLFALSPFIETTVAVIGALTLLIAGFSALAQHDIKRILAYSTISQIGYMFLALGVGAWSAAVFHFMIHAFFKALLFLGAGAIILALDEEHSIFKMGGLRKKMPVVFFTYLAASASLAALPLITAGFYSKDQILWFSFASDNGSAWLWLAGIVGALLTALYSFRMVFVAFYGEAKTEPTMKVGKLILIPLIVLGILSVVGGFIEIPKAWGNFHPLSNLLHYVLPTVAIHERESMELIFELISAAIVLIGVYVAYVFYIKKRAVVERLEDNRLYGFFYRGFDFDRLYDVVLVRPVVWLSQVDKNDFVNWFNVGVSKLALLGNELLGLTQTGRLRWYLMSFTIGVVVILTYMIYK